MKRQSAYQLEAVSLHVALINATKFVIFQPNSTVSKPVGITFNSTIYFIMLVLSYGKRESCLGKCLLLCLGIVCFSLA